MERMDPAWLAPGTVVGDWCVVRRRGGGAYGAVYLAEQVGHPEQGPFALKLGVRPWDARFVREAELLGRLAHPAVPRLHAKGWWTGGGETPFPYVVMDWVEGVSLYEWGLRAVPSSQQVFRVLAQVARALAATHAVEATHRDVKGDNMLVRADGTAVLLDFGSCNFRGAHVLTRNQPPPGTPQYQSPEVQHFAWKNAGNESARYVAQPADDVYALGVTAYRLVTGRYVAPTARVEATRAGSRWVQVPLVPPERWVSVSPELGALIARMLSAEPSQRGSAAELAEALERAAKEAGAHADLPITPVGEAAQERREVHAVAVRQRWAWRKWRARAAVAAGALLVGLWSARLAKWPVPVAQREPAEDSPDAGPARLAEAALSTKVEKALSESEPGGLRLDMPKDPFPGQLRPPCKKPLVEINGGCWAGFKEAKPPCGYNSYEWNEGCYWPLIPGSRHPTSEPK